MNAVSYRRSRLVVVVATLALSVFLGGCSPGRPVTIHEAEVNAEALVPEIVPDQIAAKLMTWADWRRYGDVDASGALPQVAPVALIWAVALHDHTGGPGTIVILDGISGDRVMVVGGHWTWPPYWDELPDLNRS